jgi:hemolysin activation/secretion protein
MRCLPRLALLPAFALLGLVAPLAFAQQQSTDVPTSAPDLKQTYQQRSEPQQVLGTSAIPPVRERQLGPRIPVTAIRFENLPEYPEHGITAAAITALTEKLRRHYTHEDEVFASGFTRAELEELAAQLQKMGAREHPQALSGEQLNELVGTLQRQRRERGLSYADLEDIANHITRFYREHGLILAKAYIPAQDVANGVVTFHVLEGRLGKVAVSGNKRYSEQRLRAPFKDQLGKAVDSRNIEQTLYLLNDYPGLNTYGFFSAGSAPGTTDLHLQVRKEQPWRFTLRGDNYGSRFTGDQRLFGMFDWFNPLGIGDRLSVGWLQSRSPVNSRLQVFNYSLPVAGPRTRFSVAYDHNDFSLDNRTEALRLLDIAGTNTNLSFALDHQLLRSRATNLAVGATLSDKKTELDALITLPNANEHVRALELRVNADHLSDRYRLLNMAVFGLQYGKFVEAVAAGRPEDYYKLSLDTSSLMFVPIPYTGFDTRLLVRTQLRYSDAALPAFEQLSLGGADGVRAFTVSDFSADSVAHLSIEWYVPLPAAWNATLPNGSTLNDLLQVGLFSDTAYGVQNSYQKAVTDKWSYLSGYGLVFKFSWSDWFSSQLSLAHPDSSKSNLPGVGDDAKSLQSFLSFTWVLQ